MTVSSVVMLYLGGGLGITYWELVNFKRYSPKVVKKYCGDGWYDWESVTRIMHHPDTIKWAKIEGVI